MSNVRLQIFTFINRIDAGLMIAAGLSLFAIQALLKPGLPTSADLAIHLYRTLEFEQAWAPGVIVPRWAPNLAYGYGYPLFVFAPPLPYILGMAFHSTGVTIEIAFKALIIFTILVYAIGMYLFVSKLFGNRAIALVAASAYTFAPFALREALLEGGNVPQLLAIGLFPWPLWAVTRAVLTRSWGWTVVSAIFHAAIMLSHLFQAFVYTPVLGLYTILMILVHSKGDSPQGACGSSLQRRSQTGSEQKHSSFLNSNFSYLNSNLLSLLPLLTPIFGLLLSAFFWLPAFVERHFTRAQADIYLEKSPFFIRFPHWSELVAWIQPFDTRAANPYAPLTLGVVTLILAGLGLLAGIVRARSVTIALQSPPSANPQSPTLRPRSLQLRSGQAGRVSNYMLPITIIFFAIIAATASFMSLSTSRRFWEMVEILQVAEFPWRMLGLANLGLAVLAGASVLLLPSKLHYPAAAVCITILILGIAPYLYPVIPFTKFGQLTIADQINYERSSQSIGTTTLGEYLPQTVSVPPTTSPLVGAFQAQRFPERLDRSSLPDKAAATLLEQTAVTHRYQLDSPIAFSLRLFQFDYPGWRARLDGNSLGIATESDTGLILIDIPSGQHTLAIHFGETPIRVFAMSLTGLTLAGFIGARIVMWRRKPAFSPSPNPDPQTLVNEKSGLRLTSPTTLITLFFIIVAVLWLKPLLRPIFTIDSPSGRVLPAQYEANIRFENGIELVGYDLSRRIVQPGDYMQVVLYWQTDSAPHRVNLQPFVHLDRLNDFTTVVDATSYSPGDATTEMNMPTFHWDNFRYVRDEHELIISPDTPPLAYAVRVGLIDPDQGNQLIPLADSSDDTAWIDTINISPAGTTIFNRQETLAQSPDVLFSNDSDAIRLTGFEMTLITAERLKFILAWESDRTPENNYTIFAQLLDRNDNLVASFDRPPLDGAYPTSTWLPNQSILDPRYLPLEGISPGSYKLITGLYNPITGQRLITTNGADFVELSTIIIE